MKNNPDILNELKELSPVLAAIEKTNVFTVPDGYFEHLGAGIMMGIENESGSGNKANTVLADAGVPDGYFDSLATAILSKVKAMDGDDAAAEIRALSPMLYSIQDEKVFEVPAGYFEDLSEIILQKVKPQPAVIKMQRRSSSFLKYAAAAVFTGVMALGVFKFTGNNTETALPDYVTAGLLVQDVDGELAKIADDEIVKFLEASGTDVKAAFVVNSIDENELPSEEDYLLDDKTLDKYLNSINIDALKN
ncbi:MAG: hypothetical protein IPL50_01870 [Chitinophagaceae bacterium]|nr:hypothetical protein [Chitinophagaceae bacterium]